MKIDPYMKNPVLHLPLFIMFLVEWNMKKFPEAESITFITDFENTGFMHYRKILSNLQLMKLSGLLMSDALPIDVGECHSVNHPRMISMAWKICKPFMKPESAAKLKFSKVENLVFFWVYTTKNFDSKSILNFGKVVIYAISEVKKTHLDVSVVRWSLLLFKMTMSNR